MGSRSFGFGFDFGFGAEVDDEEGEVEGSSELEVDDEEEAEEDEETLKNPGVVVTDLMQNPAEGVSLTWTLSVDEAIFLSSYRRAYSSFLFVSLPIVSFSLVFGFDFDSISASSSSRLQVKTQC